MCVGSRTNHIFRNLSPSEVSQFGQNNDNRLRTCLSNILAVEVSDGVAAEVKKGLFYPLRVRSTLSSSEGWRNLPRHTKEVCSRHQLRYWSTVATHRNRRPRTLVNISVLVVLRTINETTVFAVTSVIENKDNDKMTVNLVQDESAACAVEDDNTTLLTGAFQR